MAMANARSLSLYRKILRIARTWQAVEPSQTAAERAYIQSEARQLFHANREVCKAACALWAQAGTGAALAHLPEPCPPEQVTNADALRACQSEAEERIELALHYRNPYPRMVRRWRCRRKACRPLVAGRVPFIFSLTTLGFHLFSLSLPLCLSLSQPCVAPGATKKVNRAQKRQDRLRKQAMPSYLRSYNPDAPTS